MQSSSRRPTIAALVALLLLLVFSAATASDCTFQDEASGNFYDLSDFTSETDYEVDGKNIWGYTFYYHINICKNVQMRCSGTSAPSLQLDKNIAGELECLYSLGMLPGQFSLKDPSNPETGGVMLTYDKGDGDRLTRIHLACDPNAKPPYKIEFLGEPNEKQYEFKISGPAGCPNNGSCNAFCVVFTIIEVLIFIFDILLIPGIIAYFVIGILVKKFALKRTGADIIPNVTFWKNIPFIIKDGVVFTFTGIKNLISAIVHKMKNYKQIK